MFACFSQNLQTLILPINSVLRKREFWGLSDNFALITDAFSAALIRPSLTGGLSRGAYAPIRPRRFSVNAYVFLRAEVWQKAGSQQRALLFVNAYFRERPRQRSDRIGFIRFNFQLRVVRF